MDLPCARDLKSVIASVRKLQFIPPIYLYTIAPQKTGISAVDVDQLNLQLAYSPGHSRDIYITVDHDSKVDLTGNLTDSWKRYKATREVKKDEIRMLENSLESSGMHVFQHGAVVTGLHFTPDGNFLLSCGLDGTVKTWTTSGFHLVESYCGVSRDMSDIHVSPDCKHFVVSLRINGQLHGVLSEAVLYNFEKKYPVSVFNGHTDDIKCVRFHPNGLYVATASCDRAIKLWCTRTCKELRSFTVADYLEGYPKKLAFSSDGKYLASAYDESVKIWDLASGKVLKSLEIPNSGPNILNLSYNASGNVLATGGSNKKLHLWNMKSNSPESSGVKLGDEVLKCYDLDKTIYCIKNTSSFFYLCGSLEKNRRKG